jgi:mRNA-degrading endonuclease toxin of MazEF toxin-antitoxin module
VALPTTCCCRPACKSSIDTWLAALNPAIGSEIEKTKPCVIVSPAELHEQSRGVTVAQRY